MTRSRRKLILAAAAIVVVVVLALSFGGRRDGSESAAETAKATSPAAAHCREAPAPATGQAAGDRSELGARRAAVSFLELTEEALSMTPDAAASLQRSISTSASADRLAGELRSKLDRIQAQVPDGVSTQVAPIALRSTARGEGWEVSVWYLQVVVYGREVAVEQWATASYRLVWESGGWRMDDLVSTPGPIPARPSTMTATPIAQLLASIGGFSDEGISG